MQKFGSSFLLLASSTWLLYQFLSCQLETLASHESFGLKIHIVHLQVARTPSTIPVYRTKNPILIYTFLTANFLQVLCQQIAVELKTFRNMLKLNSRKVLVDGKKFSNYAGGKVYAMLIKVQSSFSDMNFKELEKLIKVFKLKNWLGMRSNGLVWHVLSYGRENFKHVTEKFNHF